MAYHGTDLPETQPAWPAGRDRMPLISSTSGRLAQRQLAMPRDARSAADSDERWGGLAAPRPLSSQTPTSRCRSATAGRRARARESPPGVGHAAIGTRVALRHRSRLPARQHVRP